MTSGDFYHLYTSVLDIGKRSSAIEDDEKQVLGDTSTVQSIT